MAVNSKSNHRRNRAKHDRGDSTNRNIKWSSFSYRLHVEALSFLQSTSEMPFEVQSHNLCVSYKPTKQSCVEATNKRRCTKLRYRLVSDQHKTVGRRSRTVIVSQYQNRIPTDYVKILELPQSGAGAKIFYVSMNR